MAGEITEPEKPPHTHVIWERDVWLESEEYGPCPLPIDHPEDHQPRLWGKILQGTEKLTVHYDAFIKGNDAKKLEPAADGQTLVAPPPGDRHHDEEDDRSHERRDRDGDEDGRGIDGHGSTPGARLVAAIGGVPLMAGDGTCTGRLR